MKVQRIRRGDIVVLKVSGNTSTMFKERDGTITTQLPFNPNALRYLAKEIKTVYKHVRLVIITGAGNDCRGAEMTDVHPISSPAADDIGLLEILKKSRMIRAYLEDEGIPCDMRSKLEIRQICGTYARDQVRSDLKKNKVMILVPSETGKSTDDALVSFGYDIGANHCLKGTDVDGIYEDNPKVVSDARLMPRVSSDKFTRNGNLKKIFDRPGAHSADGKGIPVRVFNFLKKGNLHKIIVQGKDIGSVIGEYDEPLKNTRRRATKAA